MSEKNLNAQESLSLIVEAINNTKRNLNRGSGNSFIIWGVVSFTVTLIVILAMHLTRSPHTNWLFMLIPILGFVGEWVAIRNAPPAVVTQIDKALANIALVMGTTAALIPIVLTIIATYFSAEMPFEGYVAYRIIPMLEILIVSIGICSMGVVAAYRPIQIGGSVGIALSFLTLLTGYVVYIFLVWSVVSLIIPGLKLNAHAKRLSNG